MSYMDLDLNLVKTFLTVYECKSILLASKKLYISQPAITKSIKKLENFLDCELFVRTPKGVVPTTEGEMFNHACYNSVKLLDEGIKKISSFSSLEEGYLNIGSSSTIIRKLLLPFIEQFTKKYPKIKLSITDANSEKIQKYLKNGRIDIGILNLPINEEYLTLTPLTQTTDCFIASPSFEKNFLNKEEISYFPLILQKRPSNNRDYFEKMCADNNVQYSPSIEMSSFGLITDFVSKNIGIAYTVKDFILDDLTNGRVKEIRTDLKIKPRQLALATLSNAINNSACKTFIKEIEQYFKKAE